MCLVFTTFRPYHKNFSRFYSLASQFSVARFRHTIPFLSFFQCNQLCCKFSPVKIISYNKSWQFDNRYRFLSLSIYFLRNFYSDIKTFIIFRDEFSASMFLSLVHERKLFWLVLWFKSNSATYLIESKLKGLKSSLPFLAK